MQTPSKPGAKKNHKGMKLMTADILKRLPPFGKHDRKNPIAQTKFFHPAGAATWLPYSGSPGRDIAPGLVTVIDHDDFLFFGAVTLDGKFWGEGEFTLNQLLEYPVGFYLHVERADIKPRPASDYIK